MGLLGLAIVAMPYRASEGGGPAAKKSDLGRRIGIEGHGKLEISRTNEKNRAIFASGQDWHLKLKGDKWQIVPNRNDAEQTQLFLCFCLEKPLDADTEKVALSEEPDELCLWNLEFEESIPKVSSRRFFVSPASGKYRGWFLAVGDPIETKDGVVLSRSITLHKEKSEKSQLRISVDGK